MTAVDTDAVVITEPGVYTISHTDYHADPVPGGSLSSTGARKLLPPNCPALFAYERDNPPESKYVFDIGNAAHDTLLGGGPEIVRCDFDSWRTTAAKNAAEEARERGAVPVLGKDLDDVNAMVASIRAHPFAGKLFEPGTGQPEASLFWTDERTGVNRRARLDWLPNKRGGRLIIPDLKTTRSANPDKIAKSILDWHYHQQADYYLDGARSLGLADDPVFVFVFVEKTPPYLVTVAQLDAFALSIGAHLNRRAIDVYKRCTETGEWPGYSSDVELIALPHWYERQYEDVIA